MAAVEAIAVAAGAAYILLAIARRRACWIAGGVSTALYAFVFAGAGLPLQAALQVLYVALSVYGWLAWGAGGDAAQPVRWRLRAHLIALAAVAAATGASLLLLARFPLSEAPLADALGTWASVAATWLLARRVVDSWLWWIAVDAGLAALFAGQGLAGTAALYLGYALLAVAGYRSWRRAMAPA